VTCLTGPLLNFIEYRKEKTMPLDFPKRSGNEPDNDHPVRDDDRKAKYHSQEPAAPDKAQPVKRSPGAPQNKPEPK
jgi:hypothetical protein